MTQIAWVTGASEGIGRCLSLKLAKSGWLVCATGRNQDKLDKLVAESPNNIISFSGDVSDAERMRAIVQTIETAHGPIQRAILNAGIYLSLDKNEFEKPDLDLFPFRKSMDTNYFGTLNCIAALFPHMKNRKTGQICIVSSVTGYGGLPTSSAYGPTKAALNNLAESLKFDFDRLGIDIRIVAPGFVDTPATKNNSFPMPFLVPAEDAALHIINGLDSDRFEISFPWQFTTLLKWLKILPRGYYIRRLAKITGWSD